MKKALLLFFTLFTLVSYSQITLEQSNTDELFGERREIYFMLEGAAGQAEKLTRIISIDDVKDGNVYAYASKNEFDNLKKLYSFKFYQLPKPSELHEVSMSGNPREILEWNYYPTYSGYVQLMQDFAANYPDICDIDTIGMSIEGRLILVARISDNAGVEEDEPEFLYTSSIHGDETTGYILTLHLIDYLLQNYGSDERVNDIVNNMDIWINPLANPDGTYAGGNNSVNGATRYNANGVDMNRNYPDPDDGPHPDGNQWQPETMAFIDFAENHHFNMAANFHGGAEVVNYPWDTWSRQTADDAWWRYVSREYADTTHVYASNGYMTELNNGVTNGYAWYTISGGRQDYMNYYNQCREVTLEVSSTKLLPSNQLLNLWNYNYRSMLNYMEQSLYGVRGIVTDTITGEPIKAQVFISNYDKDSSMVFNSMPIGNFHRYLKAGTYNLTFIAEGYMPKTYRNIVVNDKATYYLNPRLWNGTPIPAFTASDTLIEPGNNVQFSDNSGGYPTAFLWTFEGGTPATSTESQPVIKYTDEGTFDVSLKVTNVIGSNTITIEDYITVDDGIGVNEHELMDIYIYPNPLANQKVTIKSASNLKQYELTDSDGKVISSGALTGNESAIDLSAYKSGLYILKISSATVNKTFKLIQK